MRPAKLEPPRDPNQSVLATSNQQSKFALLPPLCESRVFAFLSFQVFVLLVRKNPQLTHKALLRVLVQKVQ